MKKAFLFGIIMLLAAGPVCLAAPQNRAGQSAPAAEQRRRPAPEPVNDLARPEIRGRYFLTFDGWGNIWKIDTVTGETWSYSLGQWVKMGE